MSSDAPVFPWLIWPTEPESFFRQTWECQALLLSRNRPDYYSGLISLAELAALITMTGAQFSRPAATGQAAGNVLSSQLAQDSLAPASGLNLLELSRWYRSGKTIQIRGLQFRCPAIAAFSRSLEETLRHPVKVSLYLTPPGAQGFTPHYDGHDIFILQIEGNKHWRCYEPERNLPLEEDANEVPRESLPAPAGEYSLHPGDLLYLPRGHIHEAFTSETASLHLTVGILAYRWVDLLAVALARLSQQDVRFRQSLPVGLVGTETVPDSLPEQFRSLVRLLTGSAQVEEALAELGERFISGLAPLPDGWFGVPLDPEQIVPETLLEKRPGMICHIREEGETVTILFPGNGVRGPNKIAPALRFVAAATGPFSARDLPANLSENARVTLLRRLLREGLLRPAEAGRPEAHS
jgi:hypothetical protein